MIFFFSVSFCVSLLVLPCNSLWESADWYPVSHTCLRFVNTQYSLLWLFLENAFHWSRLRIPRTKRGHPSFFGNPPKQMRTTLDCFKQLCWPAELLCYPGSLASSSYTPFITCFQWPPPSRLRLEGQVGCRVVHNVWGISNQRSMEAWALRPSLPFTPSRGGELQHWPRSTSPARQEVTGKEPWEPAACSGLIAR